MEHTILDATIHDKAVYRPIYNMRSAPKWPSTRRYTSRSLPYDILLLKLLSGLLLTMAARWQQIIPGS
ncbi:MAG TPA: hypothetical protein VF026_30275 [Ktedonobacteraceae bacterium]